MSDEIKKNNGEIEAEFEIPDVSALGEEFAPAEKTEAPKRGRKSSAAKAETDAPLADEIKPEVPKRGRKSSATKAEADAPLADEIKPEVPKRSRKSSAAKAEADAPLADEIKPEVPKRSRKSSAAKAEVDAPLADEVKPEVPKRSRKKTNKKAESEAPEQSLSAENGKDTAAAAELKEGAPERTESDSKPETGVSDMTDTAVGSGTTDKNEADDIGGTTDKNEAERADDVAASTDSAEDATMAEVRDEPKDSTAEGESRGFELDEEGRRIIPEDLFPDDALFVPKEEPESVDTADIIDLLGDPVTDEPRESAPEYAPVEADITPTEPAEAEPEDRYDPEHPRRIDVIFDFIEMLVFTLVAVLVITTFFVKHAVVEGESMQNTLQPNDVLLISDVFYTPSRGDIVVVEDHTLDNSDLRKPIIKRVIAVEGQLVKVEKDAIYVNAERINEPYVHVDYEDFEYYNPIRDNRKLTSPGGLLYRIATPEENAKDRKWFFGEDPNTGNDYFCFVVPEGEVFVLGDHRNNSTDSLDVGTVREDAVLGKVLLRIYPFASFGTLDEEN